MSSPSASTPAHSQEHRARLQALRSVAALEFAKGVLVLVAIISLRWLDPNNLAGAFLNLLHINPDHHLARLLFGLADRLSNVKFWHLAVGASCYSGLRFAESFGLWRARPWAEWVALVSALLPLPWEIRILLVHPSILHALVLIVNLAIVIFMFYLRLYVPRHEREKPRNLRNDDPVESR